MAILFTSEKEHQGIFVTTDTQPKLLPGSIQPYENQFFDFNNEEKPVDWESMKVRVKNNHSEIAVEG